eukprot:PITA_27858
MASSGKIEIEKFNGQSFELWKLKMEDLLVDKDQWIAVDPGTKPTGVTDEEWKKLDQKAKSTIRLCVSDSVLLNVSGEATTKAPWDKLGTLYQSKSLVNKLFLQKKMYNLRMKDGDSVTENLNAFNCGNLSLADEEMRWKNMDNQNGDALSVRGRSQNRNKNKSSSGRSKSRGRSKSPGKPIKVVCWKCGKEGHFIRDCKSKSPDKGKGSDDAPSAEAKTTSDEGGDVYLASSSTHVDHGAWLIDSGVKTVFEKDTCKMVRGALVLMRGVRIGTLYKLQGSTVVDGCNSAMVPENGVENLVVSGEKTMLWHQRLGHIGEKGLRILHGKGMVEGMSNSSLDFDFCENCVYGKQNRVSLPSGGKRTKQILELVHSDVFGLVKVPSLGKSVYYVSFIDDFSRNTWIYFLKKKSKSLTGLKEFKALVENQTEKKIKVLRTDNGGEFCSKELEEFCKKCVV